MLDYTNFTTHLAELLGLETDFSIAPDVGLYDDLSLDSIQALELLIITESLADIGAPLIEIPELYTMGDVYDYYVQLRKASLRQRI